jgi:predicted O-linked N-acetylglucosamine transferase (SPINDLY family)
MFLQDFTTNPRIDQEELKSCWQSALDGLIAGDIDEAHGAFLMPFFGVTDGDTEEWLKIELRKFLVGNIEIQQKLNSSEALAIARFSQEMFPEDINCLFQLIGLASDCDCLELEILIERGLLVLLAEATSELIDQPLMIQTLLKILGVMSEANLKSIGEEFILSWIQLTLGKSADPTHGILLLAKSAYELGARQGLPLLRLTILELCIEHCDTFDLFFNILSQAALSAAKVCQYQKAIKLAEECCFHSQQRGLVDQVNASQWLLAALMEAGEWQRIPAIAKQHAANLEALINTPPKNEEVTVLGTLIASSSFLNYVVDEPRQLHKTRNQLGLICSEIARSRIGIQKDSSKILNREDATQKILRIGYIASTLNHHSVGWLSRSLFAHHNRQDFQVFIYNINQNKDDAFHRNHFSNPLDTSYYFGNDAAEIVQKIQQDRIDILVDLDSLTYATTYEVMCCKPAPIQITWLGWDTSGCPQIDYFIADPYVVPIDAQDYYHSEIWRLPQAYVAINGFEVGVPTKHRADYDISDDGVVYLCAQKSYKHNPDILRLQMQIIKEVPNSYLLVKSLGDRDSLINTYYQVAEQVGITMDRLRFLDRDPDEYTHRANLSIADVVLDTFPYNGATTTLETLWAGVPMVTKVGQAFVARNSFSFMMNVSLTEGIAHNDEEYVAWGVKLGTDLALRQQISGKLIQSRKTSPLWNAQQFTSEMENAYRQMWGIHQEKST